MRRVHLRRSYLTMPRQPRFRRYRSTLSVVWSCTTAFATSVTPIVERFRSTFSLNPKNLKISMCYVLSGEAEPYLSLCREKRKDVLRRFLFVEGPNSYHQGSAAALRVCSYLPLPYSALSSLMVIPAPLRDAVYDYVAKRRYDWYGKGDDCLVLKEIELLERFVDWEELLERSKSKQE
ncbi:hypothetical protein SASPL_107663 [Salvia splendens]|uniref:Uncharacterized protein n=1 Tax=Salvia splendens TaxID=180675 RepID=A0A8X9A6P5_SALSN|nr:hypothetical protein SASPL_107663 [Salvia splendens]